MAVKLIANYSKRLGLPGYSSHQFSVSVETELVNVDDVAGESQRLYDLLQSNVDGQIAQTGFVPPHDYGMEDDETGPIHAPDRNGAGNHDNGGGPLNNGRWRCSPKQQELILKLVDEHELALHEVDHLARQRFGKGVAHLDKMEASGLIDELLDTHGGGSRGGRNGGGRGGGTRRSAYSGNGRGGKTMIQVASPPTRQRADVPGLPEHISPTAAKAYLACSLRFYFERVACIPKPTGPALHLGKSIHAALQRFHLALWRGEDHTPGTIATAFEAVFTTLETDEGPVSWKDDGARDKAREAGHRVVSAYLASPECLKEPPKAVEVFLSEKVAGLSVPLTGAMDLVRRDLTPVDFKSAAARPDPEQAAFEHELQLVSYQLMLEAATGERPPALELVYLVKTKTPQVIKVTARPADRHRKARVVRMLETAVQGIAEGRFHPQPGMQCSWCQYRRECAQWTGKGGVK